MNIPINTPLRVIKLTKENEDDLFYILAITVGVLTNDFPMATENGYEATIHIEGVTNINFPIVLLETDGIIDANGNAYYPTSSF